MASVGMARLACRNICSWILGVCYICEYHSNHTVASKREEDRTSLDAHVPEFDSMSLCRQIRDLMFESRTRHNLLVVVVN